MVLPNIKIIEVSELKDKSSQELHQLRMFYESTRAKYSKKWQRKPLPLTSQSNRINNKRNEWIRKIDNLLGKITIFQAGCQMDKLRGMHGTVKQWGNSLVTANESTGETILKKTGGL
jgi:FtsZ-binding cell division protein ZapB